MYRPICVLFTNLQPLTFSTKCPADCTDVCYPQVTNSKLYNIIIFLRQSSLRRASEISFLFSFFVARSYLVVNTS